VDGDTCVWLHIPLLSYYTDERICDQYDI
jgi:hypothetical protein